MYFVRPRMIRIAASVTLFSLLSAGVSANVAQAATVPAIAVKTATAPSPSTDAYNSQVLSLINQKRAAAGVSPVGWNQKIGNVSQDWAVHLGEVTKSSTFDWNSIHRSDAGGSLLPSGATWYREIIAFNGTAQSIVDWWMSSASHKAAMLDPKATDIGIGYVVPTSGPYAGLHMVVSNLAAYPQSSSNTSGTAAAIPASSKVMNTIDTNGKLWAYSTTGSSGLGSRTELGSGWGAAKQILSVDWNQDGILDIVAKWNNGYLTMYQGIGGEDYKSPINIGSGWEPYDLTATKLVKTDKYPGLVARHTTSGNLYYYSNPTGRTVGSRITLGTGGWTTKSEINAVDWDKDGKMDLIARTTSGKILLYRTNGKGSIVKESRPVIGGGGWNQFQSINAVPNFAYPGSEGVLAQTFTGQLRYYPIVKGKFSTYKLVGNFGWSGYKIAKGVI